MIFTLDIGGTYTKYAYIENNKIVSKGKWETINDFLMLVRRIDNVICSPVDFIGISSGGFWEESGFSIGYETVESTSENNLKEFLSLKYKCPVFIENDARCAMLAEQKLGTLQDCKNAVLFVLGSSLGCGVMINGNIYKGTTNQAGAMFMMPEYYDGADYRFDKAANSIAVTKKYDSDLSCGNMLFLESKALEGDEKALQLIEEYANAVALKCWYSYLAYDPECIALGGGISASQYITEKIKAHLNCFFEKDLSNRKPMVISARFGNDSNLLGASFLKDTAEDA
ncbi:MAG: ROK family protein [Eubacterium sp.]